MNSGTRFGVATRTEATVTTVVPAGKMAVAVGIATMAAMVAMATDPGITMTGAAAGTKRTLSAIRDCEPSRAVPKLPEG